LQFVIFCGRNRYADGVKTVFPGNDLMRKIYDDQAEISFRPDLLLNEYRCYRPQYHAFQNIIMESSIDVVSKPQIRSKGKASGRSGKRSPPEADEHLPEACAAP
jgi:hypothetical protein